MARKIGDVILEVEDLHTYCFSRFGTVKAVDGVSFNLRQGERVRLDFVRGTNLEEGQTRIRWLRDPLRPLQIRQRQLRKPPGIRGLQVVTIHPRQLLDVEDAGAVPDPVQAEAPRQLVERQQFLSFTGGPANQRQIVGQGLGQIAAGTELGH